MLSGNLWDSALFTCCGYLCASYCLTPPGSALGHTARGGSVWKWPWWQVCSQAHAYKRHLSALPPFVCTCERRGRPGQRTWDLRGQTHWNEGAVTAGGRGWLTLWSEWDGASRPSSHMGPITVSLFPWSKPVAFLRPLPVWMLTHTINHMGYPSTFLWPLQKIYNMSW